MAIHMRRPSRLMPLIAALAVFTAAGIRAFGQTGDAITRSPDTVHNRKLTEQSVEDRKVWSLDASGGAGLAFWDDLVFTDGTIELDIRGENRPGASFVGLAFHTEDENTYDAIYLRPFNFRSDDPERRSHSVQYISIPDFDWPRLRSERPDEFESQISPAPVPTEWVHVRIDISHPDVRLFINGGEEPTLTVKLLSERKSGMIGLWVGNGSRGEFSNLNVTHRTR